jgi:hypothetical protein
MGFSSAMRDRGQSGFGGFDGTAKQFAEKVKAGAQCRRLKPAQNLEACTFGTTEVVPCYKAG